MMKFQIFLLCALLCTGAVAAVDETVVLEKNWRAIQARELDLLPVPKNITFQEPVELKKVVIVGTDNIQYFKVICEEITSRMEELGSKVPVIISSEKVAGAYNIVVSTTPLNHPHYQSYTLEPVKDGIILQGKENNLYPAITLRYLITNLNGKTVIYPAKVLDYPDFAGRNAEIFAPWIWRDRPDKDPDKDPDKEFERAKSIIRAAFRCKLTSLNFCRQPDWRCELEFYRMPMEEARKRIDRNTNIKVLRMANDYARSLGMKNGFYYTTHALGSKADENNPEYSRMMYYACHDYYFSWARLDLHRKKADIILDFMKRSGMGFLISHCVDGVFDDPEYWSHRDQLTREKFGDDRAAASAAVYKEYMKGCAENDIEFFAVVYPYTGSLLTLDGMREFLKLPKTVEADAHIQAYLDKLHKFCFRINELVPKTATFLCREEQPKEARAFYDAFPDRKVRVDWYIQAETRDIGPTLPQEIRAFRSSFYEPRGKDVSIATVDGSMLHGPSTALSGEYSWNTAFPGWEIIDRTRNPINYDLEKTALNAERAAEGYYGMKAGKFLKPVYDNLFSFSLAVGPKRTIKNLKNPPELLQLMERNHKQLLAAIPSAERAAELDKKDFKADSYNEFVEIYLWLKAAKAYSIGNLAALKIEQAAAAGNYDLCKELQDAALKEIPLAAAEYQKAFAAMQGKSNRVMPKDILYSKWLYDSDKHISGRLFIPDFNQPLNFVRQAYAEREKIFALHNVPVWFKGFVKQLKDVYAPRNIAWPVEHWIMAGDGITPKLYSNEFRLCNPAPRLTIQNRGDALVITGNIRNPNLSKQPAQKLSYNDWPEADSIEIMIRPEKSTKGELFQFVVDPDGNLATMLLSDPNKIGKKNPEFYDFGKLPLESKREKDRWSFTLTIPYTVLGAKPSPGWKVLFGYNQDKKGPLWTRNYWTQPLNSDSRDLSCYHNLIFADQADEPRTNIRLEVQNPVAESRTHDTGAGTHITFTPALNSLSPLENVRFSAIILDRQGEKISPEMVLIDSKDVPAFWQASAPVAYQLLKPHDGFFIQLTLTAAGQPKVTRLIPVGKAIVTVPGPVPESKAYASVYQGEKPLSFRKGSLSFSIKPNFTGVDKRDTGEQLLVYAGDLKAGFRRTDSIAIRYFPSSGALIMAVYLPKWAGERMTSSMLALKKDQWKNLQFDWDLTADPVKMEIRSNGKLISGPYTVNSKGEKNTSRPESLCPGDFKPVFGGLPNGDRAFDGAIGEIKY